MPRVPKTHRPKTPLSKERILQAALELADSTGLDSVTMRGVGQVLGVEAMSLYNYVEDKEEILVGLVDRVLTEFDIDPSPESWRPAMRKAAISAHEALLRHPWACQLILTPTSSRLISSRLSYIESMLGALRHAGFSPRAASRGYHALDSHILGFTIWQLGHTLPANLPEDFMENLLHQLDPGTYPYLIEHADVHMQAADEEEGEFEFGLDLILDGLERYERSTHGR